MLPLFLLLKQLGLINTYAGVIVPSLASIFGIFLVRQYAQGIPDSLLDAARVDGASEWRIYRSIVLPLVPADPRHPRPVHLHGCVERLSLAAGRPQRQRPLHARRSPSRNWSASMCRTPS